MNVQQRIITILSELPAIGKNQRNAQQGFMFRGHDDILNALNPLLSTHGVFVVPDVLERVTAQRTTSRGGVMYEVNLHVRFRFYGTDGDYVEASTWGEGTDSGDKATNKAMTMAFKNVLNQTFAISSAEFQDADAETPEQTNGRQPAATEKPATDGLLRQMGMTLKLLNESFPEHPGDGKKWEDTAKAYCRDHFQKESVRELSVAQVNELNDWLEQQYRESRQEAEVGF